MEGTDPANETRERDELIFAHRHRVTINARLFMRSMKLPAAMLEDLEAYGTQGLIEAANKFDSARGVKFATYAEYRINGAIRNGFEMWTRGSQLLSRIRATEEPPPGANEPVDVGAAVDTFIAHASTWLLDSIEERLTTAAGLGDDDRGTTPEDDAIRHQQRGQLLTLLHELDPRRREILVLTYIEDLKSKDIAARLGVHKTRVTHMRNETLLRMREKMSAEEGGSNEPA